MSFEIRSLLLQRSNGLLIIESEIAYFFFREKMAGRLLKAIIHLALWTVSNYIIVGWIVVHWPWKRNLPFTWMWPFLYAILCVRWRSFSICVATKWRTKQKCRRLIFKAQKATLCFVTFLKHWKYWEGKFRNFTCNDGNS